MPASRNSCLDGGDRMSRRFATQQSRRFGTGTFAFGFFQFGSWLSMKRASILMIPGPIIFAASGWLRTMLFQSKRTGESALSTSTDHTCTWPLPDIAVRNDKVTVSFRARHSRKLTWRINTEQNFWQCRQRGQPGCHRVHNSYAEELEANWLRKRMEALRDAL